MKTSTTLARLRQPLTSLAASLGFYSRLQIPAWLGKHLEARGFDLATDVALVPVAGALIGVCGALGLALALGLGLPPSLSALVAIGTLVLVTGGLHEDGLADVADGFGGGADKAGKLEIMKDSRLGSFGALALGLSLAARIMLLAVIAQHSFAAAALVLIGAAGLSRFAGLIPMILLKPARDNGLGASLTKPGALGLRIGALLALLAALLPMLAGASLGAVLAGLAFALLAVYALTRLAAGQIGGQTGDVAGAAQQVAEIAFLVAFVLRVHG